MSLKILQLFVPFTSEQYSTVLDKYRDEALVKKFLGDTLEIAIKKECEEIQTDNALVILSEEVKL